VAACVLNRIMPEPLPVAARRVLADLATADPEVRQRVPGVAHIGADLELAERLYRAGETQARRLREEIGLPLIEVPLMASRPGLATTRAVAEALAERTRIAA
jgi:hypothetical protein